MCVFSMARKEKKIDMQWLRRAISIGVLDGFCVALSYFLALWLRFDFRFSAIPLHYLEGYAYLLLPWIAVTVVVFALFRLYNSIWSFVSVDELFRLILAHGVLLVGLLAVAVLSPFPMPRSFYLPASP